MGAQSTFFIGDLHKFTLFFVNKAKKITTDIKILQFCILREHEFAYIL